MYTCWELYRCVSWEYFWCRIDLLLMIFGLFPLLVLEGIKVKMEEREKMIDKQIDMYIMGVLR
jgi:hypothetical protein